MVSRRGSLLRRSSLVAAVAIFTASSVAEAGPLVAYGESDAESIALLHGYYPGYWWDHTDLTVAVQAARNVDPELREAIHERSRRGARHREENFPTVSLTDVTDTARNPHRADIVVHYVPHAGGIVVGRLRPVRATTSATTSWSAPTCRI